jgi:DNA uptake protein ComE-like DNA-binding protein
VIKTAEKILILRNKKNGFRNINELTEVKGIGLKKFEKIKKYLILE